MRNYSSFSEMIAYTFIIAISFFYTLLLTWNIPFYWMDYINIPVFSKEITYSTLSYGQEFYFRPVENVVYYIFLHIFGAYALPLRIFKALFFAGVVCFIYYFVKKYTNNQRVAGAASIFFMTLSTVLQSIMLIYDFEIIAQFFMLAAVYYFLKAFENEDNKWKYLVMFSVLTYIALLTKESTKVFVGIFFAFLLLHLVLYKSWNKLKFFIIASLLLLFVAVQPGILIGLESPSSGALLSFFVNWFDINNVLLFLKYLLISGFSILLLFFYMVLTNKAIPEKKEAVLFFALWFVATAFLTAIVSMVDVRYAIVALLPFVIFTGILVGDYFSATKSVKNFFLWAIIILFIFNICINVGLSAKYRYGFGNFFIVLDESHNFVETTYTNNTFIYTDSTAHFYGFSEKNNYIEYGQLNELEKKDAFFFSLQSPLQTKEQETAQLVKTFQKGPQCFMLYESRNESIMTHNIFDNTYEFSEPTILLYCTIELKTRFILPSDIVVAFIGDTENVTMTISPPVGKSKSCEYICPVFENNKTAVQKIVIFHQDNFLTEIYSAKVHYVEKT